MKIIEINKIRENIRFFTVILSEKNKECLENLKIESAPAEKASMFVTHGRGSLFRFCENGYFFI